MTELSVYMSSFNLIATDSLEDCVDLDSMFSRIVLCTRTLGFDYAAFGMQMPLPLNSPKVVTRNNYGQSWWDTYLKNNYFLVDPVVRHVLVSDTAVLWSDAFFSSAPAFWESAKLHGMRYGWTKGTRSESGMISQLSLVRSERQLSEEELAAKEPYMKHLAEIAHRKMAAILVAEQFPESSAELTLKEFEVIRWCADGKTNVEIALISNVSVSTVNFHMNNILKKLGASNKTHAVMKASRFGWFGRPGS